MKQISQQDPDQSGVPSSLCCGERNTENGSQKMTYSINLNYDDSDTEFHAVNCGIVSRLAEELKYRVEEVANSDTISGLETMEFEYWNEANENFEFWDDAVDFDIENSDLDELKNEILEILKEISPKMTFDKERDFISEI